MNENNFRFLRRLFISLGNEEPHICDIYINIGAFCDKRELYSCSICCDFLNMKNIKIFGIDELDAVSNAITFAETMLKGIENSLTTWADGTAYFDNRQ